MSFVFFDTETTGLRRGFDQIVHFAAIKTDNDLNEVDRFETRSRLLPFVVPNPSALLTSGITIERLQARELPSHSSMVAAIERILSEWSPSIFVGYNSIRFDEEMLRHALFQSLRPAYLTSQPRNGRADALTLMMAASALSPAAVSVPTGQSGRPTFRLGTMAMANGVAHGLAHDAMGDAEATLELCRLVKDRSPDVWQRFVRFSSKASVRDFVDSGDAFVLTEFYGGNAYHTPVIRLGQMRDYVCRWAVMSVRWSERPTQSWQTFLPASQALSAGSVSMQRQRLLRFTTLRPKCWEVTTRAS